MNIKLTYFTPTYNRSNLLQKLYISLCSQTNKCFIWLIIDDGSTDETNQLVEKWKHENIINIKYVYKENGGKHTAIDLSSKLCKTDYITTIDSDDFLTPDATDVIYSYINICTDNILGIVGRRAHYDGTPFDENWCKKNQLIYFHELNQKYKYNKDTILIFNNKITKNYKFPQIPNEKFITEAVLYNQFMFQYKMIVMEECVYLAEYQNDGYTAQGMNLFFKNPLGYLYYLKQSAYCNIKFKHNVLRCLYYLAKYHAWKNVLNLKDPFPSHYKACSLFDLGGKLLQVLFKRKLKANYIKFKNKKSGGI